jgi:hypothetical protein
MEGGESANFPGQLVCRDADHGWAPYAERGTQAT